MNKVYAYFSSENAGYGTIPYPVVFDAPITEEYSETLDSATIVVPNIPLARRLDIEPYQECALEITSGDTTTTKVFLIDSVTESVTNVNDANAYYTYTIDLMSETKYLEKIQCPNLVITHSEVSGANTIMYYVSLYMSLYCPKIKFYDKTTGTWNYKPLIAVSSAINDKFSVPCADMSMSKPTLRQVLTSLMIQKSCIPTVVNRTLGFLDLAKEPSTFNRSTGRLTVERSISSDSYVNTLVNMSDNVIDQGDCIVSESLVFRDRDNLLLKQKENLELETRYPIYSVSNFTLNAYCNTNLYINKNGEIPYRYFVNESSSYYSYFGLEINMQTDREKLRFLYQTTGGVTTEHTFKGYAFITTYICHWTTDNRFVVDKTLTQETDVFTLTLNNYYDVSLFNPASNGYSENKYTTNCFALHFVSYYGTMDGATWNKNFFISDAYDQSTTLYSLPAMFHAPYSTASSNYMQSAAFNPSDWSSTTYAGGWILSYLYKKDITPLLVENSKRSQLNVDFLAMPSAFVDVETMSKWLYCTVGYSIGSNVISGFSTTYSKSYGFWDSTKTYIENIFKALQINDQTGESLTSETIHDMFGGALDKFTIGIGKGIEARDNTLINPFFEKSLENFTMLFFDIAYTPLNKVVMRHFKDDVDLPLEQLNSSEDGISSATLLSMNQQETIDRLGNDVIGIHERISTLDELQELPCDFNGYTIFKREYKIGKNAIDVNYYASKNHIIKNYFTSIMTKYRAYEYVDYNKSVLRRESDCVHMLFSQKGYLNGDDKLEASAEFPLSLIDGIMDKRYGKKLNYSYNGGASEWYKSECATYTTDSSVYMNYTQFDNGSEGIFIDGKYLDINGNYASDPIGGIPQQWYAPYSGWKNAVSIGFVDNIGVLIPQAFYYQNSTYLTDWIRTLQAQPKFTFPSSVGNYVNVIKTIGKDLTELISYTLQLDMYSDDGNIQFSKWLYRASTALGGTSLPVYAVYDSDDFNPIGYTSLPSGASQSIRMTLVGDIQADTAHMPRMRIRLNETPLGHNTIKFLCKGTDGLYHDMIKFKTALYAYAPGYYISFNDTKGDKVFSESTNGCLVANHTAKKTTTAVNYDRIVSE